MIFLGTASHGFESKLAFRNINGTKLWFVFYVNSPSNEMIDFYIWDKRMTNWWDLLPDHVDIFDKRGWPKQLWILSRKKDTSAPHTELVLT